MDQTRASDSFDPDHDSSESGFLDLITISITIVLHQLEMALYCLNFFSGTMWENWCLVGSIGLCLPVLLLLKERYNRLDIDIVVEDKQTTDEK